MSGRGTSLGRLTAPSPTRPVRVDAREARRDRRSTGDLPERSRDQAARYPRLAALETDHINKLYSPVENRNRQSGWCLLKEALAWQTIHGWIVSEERSVCGSAYLDAAGGEVVCFMEVAAGPGWCASVAAYRPLNDWWPLN